MSGISESTRPVKYLDHRLVLFLELADLPNKAIAEQLDVSVRTVIRYRRRIEKEASS